MIENIRKCSQPKKLWLWDKFSQSVPKGMYREEYRGIGYWCWSVRPGLINPKSNYHLISSYSNTATYKSYSTVVRIKESYCQPKKLWLLDKFSLSVPKGCIERSIEKIDTDIRMLRLGLINPKSDYHLTSCYSNTAESFFRIMEITEMMASLRIFHYEMNSS